MMVVIMGKYEMKGIFMMLQRKNNGKEIFYRYYDQRYAAPLDEYDNPCGNGALEIHCSEYPVVKHTAKSILLKVGYGFNAETKWMRIGARKVFAAPTKKEALYHFIKRKERQILIYKNRLNDAKEAKALAERELS